MQKQFLSRLPLASKVGGIVEDDAPTQRDSIRWLIGCGVALIAMIAIATAFMVSNYRDRAIKNAEREAESVVSLLARHFDQELGDFTAVQAAFADKVKGVESPDEFRRVTASYEIYLSRSEAGGRYRRHRCQRLRRGRNSDQY